MLTKIISGGQTGTERAALDVAFELDIPHGGWIPKGRNVNLEMVTAGLSEVYRGRAAPRGFDLLPYWQAEKEAKDDLRGMWSLGDEYVSPKTWRKMHRKK